MLQKRCIMVKFTWNIRIILVQLMKKICQHWSMIVVVGRLYKICLFSMLKISYLVRDVTTFLSGASSRSTNTSTRSFQRFAVNHQPFSRLSAPVGTVAWQWCDKSVAKHSECRCPIIAWWPLSVNCTIVWLYLYEMCGHLILLT